MNEEIGITSTAGVCSQCSEPAQVSDVAGDWMCRECRLAYEVATGKDTSAQTEQATSSPVEAEAVDFNKCPGGGGNRCKCEKCDTCGHRKHTAQHGPYWIGTQIVNKPWGHPFMPEPSTENPVEFNRGDRVQLSPEGLRCLIHMRGKQRYGKVCSQPRGGSVGVMWDGKRTPFWYSRKLISPIEESPIPGTISPPQGGESKSSTPCPTCIELRAENSGLSTNLKIARLHWTECQNRLAEIERVLNGYTGLQADIPTCIDTLKSDHDELRAENERLKELQFEFQGKEYRYGYIEELMTLPADFNATIESLREKLRVAQELVERIDKHIVCDLLSNNLRKVIHDLAKEALATLKDQS